MASPSSFRIPAEELSAWVARLAAWRGTKGVDAVLREIEDAAAKPAPDGHVVVTRHQLFSWAEALQGQAVKLPLAGGDAARALSGEVRSYLTGQPAPGASAPPPTPAATYAPPPPAPVASGLSWEAPRPAAAPPITYLRPGGSTDAPRLVADRELAETVRSLVRNARQELLVVSPWRGGLDSLLADVLALPPGVAVRVLTRRPEPDDAAYHRALQDLARRKVDLATSPYLHTRMIVADAQTLLLGAASLPGPTTTASREAALLTSDPKAVADARQMFANVQRELRGG